MAPIRKRAAARLRAGSPSKSSNLRTTPNLPLSTLEQTNGNHAQTHHSEFEDWRLSKKDKRVLKRGLLLQKVRDAGISKHNSKRRRPSKKLNTDLTGLASALPDVNDDEWEGIPDVGGAGEDMGDGLHNRKSRKRQRSSTGDGIICMKSLRHTPGAMKRKREAESREMERFGRNLAQLADSSYRSSNTSKSKTGGGETNSAPPSQQEKWAALRSFISGTMEVDKAFAR